MLRTVWLTLIGCFLLPTLGGCAAAAGDMGSMAATAAGVPQINAFLPNKAAVPVTTAMPIDGVYTISTIQKQVRMEGGRAYAMQPWLHAFTLKVQPDMVVARNIQRTGPGEYAGDDLPLMAKARYALQPDGSLAVVAQGMMGPARFALIPVSVDDPSRFNAELQAMGYSPLALTQTPGVQVIADQ